MPSSRFTATNGRVPLSGKLPVCPATVTTSPTRNGRSVTSITPDAMLDSESFSARPTARPAVPSTASSGVICTPSVPIASTTTITSDAAIGQAS
ncbi:hypothetical protein G6F59_018060 [Rhizopus arrhizus]|nr:hypothetical protein G6F59_018060 [Rhizopus arrhizus]